MNAVRVQQQVFVLFLVVSLSACSGFLTLPTVDDPKDGVAVAYATIGSAATTVTAMVENKTLSADKAREVQGILERAYGLTTIADTAVRSGVPQDAVSTLVLVNNLLADIQVFLGREF